jgi:hypothetical protein
MDEYYHFCHLSHQFLLQQLTTDLEEDHDFLDPVGGLCHLKKFTHLLT